MPYGGKMNYDKLEDWEKEVIKKLSPAERLTFCYWKRNREKPHIKGMHFNKKGELQLDRENKNEKTTD
jgi:hypothetical protein